ncbi:hypothetical protein ACI6QG_14305 [Roseococcus sp. DSY-14]|uniref:hypothetical protein n=1 Tax=Roseococcus sp. DSY-14 TaxID=3369650 RepID=UPI00387B5323
MAKSSTLAGDAALQTEADFAPRRRLAWPAAILAILGFSLVLWGMLLMGIGALIG